MKIKLNLIPPEKKEEIKKSYRLRKVLRWETELLLIGSLFTVSLFSMNYILQINLTVASNALNSAANNNSQYKEIAKYDSDIKNMNSLVADVNKIQSGQLYWSKFLVKMDGKVSAGIEIDSVQTKNYAISLVGKADTRDNLLAFKNNIEQDDCFTDVNLPLSDLVTQNNIAFQMDFQIKKECINPNVK